VNFPAPITLQQIRRESAPVQPPRTSPAPAALDIDLDSLGIDLDAEPEATNHAPAPLPRAPGTWPAPAEITTAPPPSLDLDAAIPADLQTFRAFCLGLSEALQVPPDAVPPLALTIASGCVARAVETRSGPDWVETPPLWCAVLMQSAERKSALISALARPVFDWQASQAEALRRPLAAYAENRRCLEAELATARARYAKTKLGTPERSEAQTTVREIAETLDAMPALSAPAIITADATPESLRELLLSNGEKAVWISAEADAASLTGKRYSKTGEANLNLFLAAKSGDPCPGQRIGRDISLSRPSLAACLCVQPCALDEVLADPYARGRGFVPRFNFVTPPSRLGSRTLHPEPLSPALAQWWADALRSLLAMPWPGRVVADGGELKRHAGPPRELRLAPDAVPILDTLRIDIERRIGPDGDLRAVQAYASKLPGEIVRISAILELLADPGAATVGPETMRAAVAWGAFLLDHYRHALGEASATAATKDARRLLDALRRNGATHFVIRDALRYLDADRETVDRSLAILDAEGWTRLVAHPPRSTEDATKGGRPPGPMREVNPALFAQAGIETPVPNTDGKGRQ
jgi:hypothetical protein